MRNRDRFPAFADANDDLQALIGEVEQRKGQAILLMKVAQTQKVDTSWFHQTMANLMTIGDDARDALAKGYAVTLYPALRARLDVEEAKLDQVSAVPAPAVQSAAMDVSQVIKRSPSRTAKYASMPLGGFGSMLIPAMLLAAGGLVLVALQKRRG